MTDAELTGHFSEIKQGFERVDKRFDRLEAQVHRHGVLLEELNDRVKLVAEGVETLATVTNQKFDAMYEKIDRRIAPLEAVVRSHSEQLARHEERLSH